MLVLGRKPGETIVAGDVIIHVLTSRGGRIRLGIEAPASVNIHRGELADESDPAPCLVEISSVDDEPQR